MLRCVALCLVLFVLLSSTVVAQDWINQRLNQDETTQLQNEEQIAINPTNPDNMVAVWRDFRLGFRQVGWAYTFDGGQTWTEGGLIEEPNYPRQSDPGVTSDIDGNFWAVILSYTGSTSQENGLYALKSTDGGVSWGEPLEIVNQVPNVFEDKEFLACDRTGTATEGNLYCVWTRFGATTQIIGRRSTNDGLNWSGDRVISDQSFVQFPIPVVGRQGEVYCLWTSYGGSSIRIDKSTDGGNNWGTDRTVVSVSAPSDVIFGGIDVYSSPHADADITDGPFSGRLYCSFMDTRDSGDRDIYVTWSDDMGVNWSNPVRINDDATNNGRDQFHPWLWVDNQGIVTVIFLDRRDDPGNLEYHCYMTQSTDGGATWASNVRISTAPSNPFDAGPLHHSYAQALDSPQNSQQRAGLIGEYIGVVAWDGRATPVWTDIRNGNQDVFTAHEDVTAVGDALPAALGRAMVIYPNPVRPGRSVHVRARSEGPVVLRVYDAGGRVLRELTGSASLQWDGDDAEGHAAGAGVYYMKLSTPEGTVSGRIVLVE